ncbi:MAG: NUDIX hydrolase [Flavobacteriales bacterium]|nr:NUDIX hydrolase [Crocinitomicaceae bacterium]MBO75613.1 NUDIX hydrolase [Flavobacteriales bacterium]
MPPNESLHLSVDCALFGYDDQGLKVLLINQKEDTYTHESGQPMSQLPGDLILIEEGLHEAAERVLFELTQVKGVYLKQFHAYGDPNRVKDHKDRAWLRSVRTMPDQRVVTVGYLGLVSLHDYNPQPASFAGGVSWVDINEVGPLAFDHNSILNGAIEALQNQLESHHISFELLPKKFTLSQLQALYETVLHKKFDKRNFRKNVKKMSHVVPLDEKQQGVMHKPAQLFSFNPDQIENE